MKKKFEFISIALIVSLFAVSSVFGASSITINSPSTSSITYPSSLSYSVTASGNTSTWTVKLFDNETAHPIAVNTSVANNTLTTLLANMILPGGANKLIAQLSAPGVSVNSTPVIVTVAKYSLPFLFYLSGSKNATSTPYDLISFKVIPSIPAGGSSVSTTLSSFSVSQGGSVVNFSGMVGYIKVPKDNLGSPSTYTISWAFASNQNYSSKSGSYKFTYYPPQEQSGPVSITPPVSLPPQASTTSVSVFTDISNFFSSVGSGISAAFSSLGSALSGLFRGI